MPQMGTVADDFSGNQLTQQDYGRLRRLTKTDIFSLVCGAVNVLGSIDLRVRTVDR